MNRLSTVVVVLALAALGTADPLLVGTSYCNSAPSSAGQPTDIQVLSLAHHAADAQQVHLDDQLLITAYPLPLDVLGWVIAGPSAGTLPFGGGTLCLASPFARIAQDVAVHDYFDAEIDLRAPGLAHVPFAPGDWYFQVVFRDPGTPGQFNLSDAVHVTLIP